MNDLQKQIDELPEKLDRKLAALKSGAAVVGLRPCFVKERKGHFHCWGTFADEDGSCVNGVVEFEDGKCDCFPPNMIKFADKAI